MATLQTLSHKSPSKIAEIEVLRAIAIIFTVFHHSAFSLLPKNNFLLNNFYGYFTYWGGVDLFFVISGFVIMRSLNFHLEKYSKSHGYFKVFAAFWIRRIFRILPSAWLWLTTYLVINYYFNTTGVFGNYEINFQEAISGFLQYANYHGFQCAAHLARCGPNGVYWSLSLEEQFYILLPLTILVFRRFFPIALIAFLIPQLLIERYEWSFWWAFRFDTLIWGVLLLIFSKSKYFETLKPKFMKNQLIRWPIVITLITLMAYFPQATNGIPLGTSFLGLACLVLVFISAYDDGFLLGQNKFRSILLWLGSRSYSIYLIHMFTFKLAYELMHQLTPVGHQISLSDIPYICVIAFSLLFLLSELSYRIIEMPTKAFGVFFSKKLLRVNNH